MATNMYRDMIARKPKRRVGLMSHDVQNRTASNGVCVMLKSFMATGALAFERWSKSYSTRRVLRGSRGEMLFSKGNKGGIEIWHLKECSESLREW